VRIKEASKLGFKRCLIPKSNRTRIATEFETVEILGVQSVEETLEILF